MRHDLNGQRHDIERSNIDGIGKQEPLKGELSGFWSRRIDATIVLCTV